MTRALSLSAAALMAAGCASQQVPAGATARPAGCVVELLREGIPTRTVRRIANLSARCTGEIAADRARCERLLMDEACSRGGQVLWDFRTEPYESDGVILRATAGFYP